MNISPASLRYTQPAFGAIRVNKASLAKSGLGPEATDNIDRLARQLQNNKSLVNPYQALDDLGIDIEIQGSDSLKRHTEGRDGQKRLEVTQGPVTVIYRKAGQFAPTPAGRELHRFENFYNPADHHGERFFSLVLEDAVPALDALYQGRIPSPKDPA